MRCKVFVGILSVFLSFHSIAQIYLHTDRQAYALGDTLHYAAHIPHHQKDSLTTLYVEMVDAYKRIIATQQRPIIWGQADGGIIISDTLMRGPYRLRAYTWSGEQESNLFWITMKGNIMTLAPPIDSALSVKFYPEGGNLVQDLPSRVVIATKSLDGQGVNAHVVIKTTSGQQIVQTQTDKLGLGEFVLVPYTKQKYVAQITWRDSMMMEVALPNPKQQGVVLQIDSQTNKDLFKVRILYKRDTQPETIYLLGYAADSLIFSLPDSSGRKLINAQIQKKLFPKGIIKFILIDKERRILAQRQVTNQEEGLKPVVKLTKEELPNGGTNLKIIATAVQQEMTGRGSISLIDTTQEMYFDKSIRDYYSDRYMITLPPVQLPIRNEGLWAMAQVLDERNRPVSFANLLLLETKSRQSVSLITDEKGYFKIAGMSHEKDTLNWVIQRVSGKNKPQKTVLKIIQPERPNFGDEGFPMLMRKGFTNDTIADFKEGTTLTDVKVRAKRYIEREYYLADYNVDVSDKFIENAGVVSAIQLINFLKQTDPRFMRMRSQKNRGPSTLLPAATQSNPEFYSESLDPFNRAINAVVIIDRHYYPDVDNRLSGLSAYDIERVEIVRTFTKPIIVDRGGHPPNPNKDFIIAITTRMGAYGSKQYTLNQTISKLSVVGYTPNIINKNNSTTPVYWHPSISFPTIIGLQQLRTNSHYKLSIKGITSDNQYIEKIDLFGIN